MITPKLLNIIPPKGDYITFTDESHYTEKIKEWGLSAKKQFLYKDGRNQESVTIIGYEIYGKTEEYNTIIIEFNDGQLSCIHPAYLKEMQASSFKKTNITSYSNTNESVTDKQQQKEIVEEQTVNTEKTTAPQVEKKIKQEKKPKIDLPEEKVRFSANVKQFALTWNNFNEENDEVIVLENVVIHQDTPIEIGHAWCSHSKTLKKHELTQGDTLEFDGKIIKKKLPKGKDVDDEFIVDVPVYYKVNNPSKIKKS